AIKKDGAYQADPTARFHNQAPQMAVTPGGDIARWAFTAWGYLWVPWAGGLLKLGRGASQMAGPEQVEAEDLRFVVRSGTELRGHVFLLCQAQSGSDTVRFIVKMH